MTVPNESCNHVSDALFTRLPHNYPQLMPELNILAHFKLTTNLPQDDPDWWLKMLGIASRYLLDNISMDCCTFFVTISEACFRIVFFSAVSIIEKCLCLFGSRWFTITIHQWITFNQVLNRNRPALMAATLRAAYGTGPQTRTPVTPVTPSVSATPHTPHGASLAPQCNPRTPANTARKAFLWEAASKKPALCRSVQHKILARCKRPILGKDYRGRKRSEQNFARFFFAMVFTCVIKCCLRVDMCFHHVSPVFLSLYWLVVNFPCFCGFVSFPYIAGLSPRPGECYPFVCKHQQSVSGVGGQCVWGCQ